MVWTGSSRSSAKLAICHSSALDRILFKVPSAEMLEVPCRLTLILAGIGIRTALVTKPSLLEEIHSVFGFLNLVQLNAAQLVPGSVALLAIETVVSVNRYWDPSMSAKEEKLGTSHLKQHLVVML